MTDVDLNAVADRSRWSGPRRRRSCPGRKDAGPGVHSHGLLQLTVLRHYRRSDEPVAVCPECGCTFGVGRSTLRPHHASATGAALASVRRRVDFKMATLVYLSLSGMAPAYLAAECHFGLRQRSSSAAFCHIKDMRCEANVQQLWRRVFLQLQVRSCGTAFQLNCDKLTLAI